MAHFKLNKYGNYFPFDIGAQHFSGGDYSKTKADDLGIVFPYNPEKNIKDEIVVSSLIDHHTDDYHLLKHTEVRDCNKIDDDLVYSEMLTATIVMHDNKLGIKSNSINNFFDEETAYIEAQNPIIMNEVEKLMEIYKNFPTITFIDKDNIQEKKYPYKRYDYSSGEWRTPGLFGYNGVGYMDDEHDPVVDEEIEKILNKWFKKTKLPIQVDEVYSYLFEYETFSKKAKKRIGGILEFIMMDKKRLIRVNSYGELIAAGCVEYISFIRNQYKYTKQEIEKDSDKIMKLLEKQYESQ